MKNLNKYTIEKALQECKVVQLGSLENYRKIEPSKYLGEEYFEKKIYKEELDLDTEIKYLVMGNYYINEYFKYPSYVFVDVDNLSYRDLIDYVEKAIDVLIKHNLDFSIIFKKEQLKNFYGLKKECNKDYSYFQMSIREFIGELTDELQKEACNFYFSRANNWLNHSFKNRLSKFQLYLKFKERFYVGSYKEARDNGRIYGLICASWNEGFEEWATFYGEDSWIEFKERYQNAGFFDVMRDFISKKNAIDAFDEFRKKEFKDWGLTRIFEPEVALKFICHSYKIDIEEVTRRKRVIDIKDKEEGIVDFISTLIEMQEYNDEEYIDKNFLEILKRDYSLEVFEYRRLLRRGLIKDRKYGNPEIGRFSSLPKISYQNQTDSNTSDFEYILHQTFWNWSYNKEHIHSVKITVDDENKKLLVEWDVM